MDDPVPIGPDDEDDAPVEVYALNICERVLDHSECPLFTTLYAGEIELGPVVCNCECHRKLITEVTQ